MCSSIVEYYIWREALYTLWPTISSSIWRCVVLYSWCDNTFLIHTRFVVFTAMHTVVIVHHCILLYNIGLVCRCLELYSVCAASWYAQQVQCPLGRPSIEWRQLTDVSLFMCVWSTQGYGWCIGGTYGSPLGNNRDRSWCFVREHSNYCKSNQIAY
jgi:hypothetical protein